MPHMTGVEAAKMLRAAGFRNIIAGITGNVMVEDKLEFLNAGANIVLSKPVSKATIEKLLQLVEIEGPEIRPKMIIEMKGDAMAWVTTTTSRDAVDL